MSHLLSCAFNPSWATPLLPAPPSTTTTLAHCDVNAALSVQGTKYARGDNEVGVRAHLIYASMIAFDDVDHCAALWPGFVKGTKWEGGAGPLAA